MRMLRPSLVIASILALMGGRDLSARGQEPAKPPAIAAEDRRACEALASAILQRLDSEWEIKAKARRLSREASWVEADRDEAQHTLELAEIALQEYQIGTLPAQRQMIEGEIQFATAELARASDRLNEATKQHANGAIPDWRWPSSN